MKEFIKTLSETQIIHASAAVTFEKHFVPVHKLAPVY